MFICIVICILNGAYMYVYAKNKDVKITKAKESTRVYRGVNYLSII